MAKLKKEIPVTFGGKVSVGETVTNISVTIPRSTISLDDADANLCGRRITGTIRVVPKDVAQGQKSLDGMDDAANQITGAFDVKSIRVTPESIKFGMAFDKNDVGSADLRGFVKKEGRLKIGGVSDIPGRDDVEIEEPDEEEPPKPSKRQKSFVNDPAAAAPIKDLAKYGLTAKAAKKALDVAKGPNIGDLEAVIRKSDKWQAKLDVPTVVQTLRALVQHRSANKASEEDVADLKAMLAIAQAREAGAEAVRRGIARDMAPYDAGTPQAAAWLAEYDANAKPAGGTIFDKTQKA